MSARPTAAKGTFPFEDHRTVAQIDGAASLNLGYKRVRNGRIVDLYRAGHSCIEIAEHFALSPSAIREIVHRSGIKMRPQGSRGIGPVRIAA